MKKFIVVVLVLSLVMSLTVMAQAEVRNVVPSTEVTADTPAIDIVEIATAHHLAKVYTGNVTCDIHFGNEEDVSEEEPHKDPWYVKTCRWCSNAAIDVADFVVFWN